MSNENSDDDAKDVSETPEFQGTDSGGEISPGEDGAAGGDVPDKVEDLQSQVQSLNEKILRMAAENQNTRKRLVKQQQDAYKYRHQDILKDLADVIDNFERAIESAADSRDFDTFYEGILMIEKQFSGMLTERYSLERVGAEGDVFDPAAHEAVMAEESPDLEEETVKQVFQAGYRLHDRILRPAKVVVYKPIAEIGDEENGEGENG